MPIVIQLESVQFDVLDASAGGGEQARILVLTDAVSGIKVTVPMLHDAAERMGAQLRGTSVIPATAIPHIKRRNGGK